MMHDNPKAKDARSLIEMIFSFYSSRVIMSAIELKLFDVLHEEAMTGDAIRDQIGLAERSCFDFLDSLVALNLLCRDKSGRYENSELADTWLRSEGDFYVGGFAEMSEGSLYNVWGKLTELLKSGEPQLTGRNSFFAKLYENRYAAERFMNGMDSFNYEISSTILSSIEGFSPNKILDVGGARGDLLRQLLTNLPNASGIVLDLPQVEPLFNDHVTLYGLSSRLTFISGDFREISFPKCDMIIFGHVLHGVSENIRLELLIRAFEALNNDGFVCIYDRMIANDRASDPLSLLGSLGMALVSPVGSEYTPNNLIEFIKQADFMDLYQQNLAATDTLIVAKK